MAAAQETAPPATAPPVTAQETDPAAPPTVEPATPPANVDAAPPAAGAEAPATPPDAMPVDPAEPRPAGAGEEALSPILPHDLSPWGMFMAADIVVKAVMIGLAFASLITWTVWLAKSLELFAARMKLQRAVTTIVRARTLDDASKALADAGGTGSLFVEAARQEVSLSEPALEHVDGSGLKERVASRLTRIEAQASRRMTRGTGLLATIGSTAPFVGLFGTVWGIMNAFIGISESQTTNLAVVAPGIAEALLATALGLVAAIPAVVIYNVFARAIAGYRQVLADAAAGVERLVSRDLDYRTVPRSAAQRGA
ncbi:MAG: tonB-system energizer ExbB [Rhizobiaceae bacterium]